MTISTTTNTVSYTGNGSTTAFAIPYVFFGTATSAEIQVVQVTTATGAESIKTNGTDFTVSGGSGATGTVTASVAPATTVKWVINRVTTQTQETDYVENDAFPAESHEDALDRLTAISQEQERALGRTAQLPDGYTGSFDPELPTVITASTALIINSGGDGFAIGPTTTEISNAQASATAASNSADASAASASTSSTQATLSTNYATKIDGAITGADYSSKAWSIGGSGVTTTSSRGASKEWATTTGGAVDTSEFSAKEYALGTTATSAKSYALKVDGAVTGSDFSSKAWAVGGTSVTSTGSRGAAKEWATTTGAAVDTSEFSSKEYAVGSTVTTGSAKEWALGGGSSFTEGTAVAGGVFSARKYAANAAASASVAASGQIYSTVVNQTGATLSPAISADGTYYLCDTSSNNITVTLPAIGTSEGVKYAFQKTSASNSLIFARSGSDTLNGSASNITMTDVNAQIQFVSDDNSPDNWVGVNLSQITVGTGLTKTGSVVSIDQTHLKQTIAIACGDEVTATAAATAVVTFHMPYAFTLTGIKAGVTTAPVGSVLTVDLNEAGSTCLTTKLTIDAGEKTSGTAATAPVIGGAGPALADNALMTIDVDGVGSGTAGAGLKVYLIGYAT